MVYKNFVIIVTIFVINTIIVRGQEKFSLIKVISEYDKKDLIVFNVIETTNSKIYIGTSKGAFELDSEYQIEKVSNISGPIGWNQNNLVNIKIDAISRTDKYQYLSALQNPIEQEDPFLRINNTLFLVVDGKLRIYQLLIEQKTLKKISIRSISENFIGSYDGIFKRTPAKDLLSDIETDSHIREINDRIFICYSGLAEYKNDKLVFYNNELEEFEILGNSYGFIRDISATNKKNQFIVYTTKGVYLTDLETFIESIILSNGGNEPSNRLLFPKHIKTYFEKDYNDRVLFFINKKIYLYFFNSQRLEILTNLESNILDSFINENGLYILDEFYLRNYNSNKGISNIANNDHNYHSFTILNDQLVVFISDFGVWLYDLNLGYSNIISNQEFNYGAKYSNNDSLFLGGIDGISSFSINDLLNYPVVNKNNSEETTTFNRILYTGISIVIIFLLGILFLILKNKSTIEYVDQNKLLQLEIETFIESNLSIVTLEILKENFNVSYGKLNNLYAPRTVAKVIEDKRKSRVKESFEKRLSLEEISKISGYSITYLKRLLAKRRS